MHTTLNKRKRGVSLLYSSVIMVSLFGISSLAVDWGRVQVAKSQMRAAVDAASRNAALLLTSGAPAAVAGAVDAADDNIVDGSPLLLNQSQDIEVGSWNSTTRQFTKLSGPNLANANAVRVIGRRIAARGNAVPTIFAQIFGQRSCDVTAESISMRIAPTVTQYDIPATASPFLAGMPTGTRSSPNNPHNNPDYAPYQSPVQIGVNLTPGSALSFNTISGGANNDLRNSDRYNPDGNTNAIEMNRNSYGNVPVEHGKSSIYGPLNALVGVFLTDAVPTNGSAPENLDFSDATKRNFSSLSPKIAQVFFIGDGKQDNGTSQTFTVPQGATRFYLANWDGYEWNNNVGVRTTAVTRLGSVVTVK